MCCGPAAGQSADPPSGGDYTIERSVMAAGGGAASGGPYTLNGTIAQPEAGGISSAGSLTLQGGFWAPEGLGPAADDFIFADGFETTGASR